MRTLGKHFAARGAGGPGKSHVAQCSDRLPLRLNAQTAVAETQDEALPQALSLWPNYLNPFNSGTVFRFALPEAGAVELTVYNLAGQQVAAPLAGWRAAGTYELPWDGRDGRGRTLASGVYFYACTLPTATKCASYCSCGETIVR